jgi:hypothetical protein
MQKSLRKPRGADGKLVIIVVVVVLAVLILSGLAFYAYK